MPDQPFVADLIEAGLDVAIQNPLWRRPFGQQLKAAADGIVSGSAFPETVGVPVPCDFRYRFQRLQVQSLHAAVDHRGKDRQER